MKTRTGLCVVAALLSAACPQKSPGVSDPAAATPKQATAPVAAASTQAAPTGPAPTAAPTATPTATKSGKKPNVLFLLVDDFSMNLLQYMPHVLEMQKEGATFPNYFVTDSLCCPSRSTIFTGKFPHNTGVVTNSNKLGGGYKGFMTHGNDPVTFAVALENQGYKTAMMGKFLNEYSPETDPPGKGWSEWVVAGEAYREFNYTLNIDGRVEKHGSDPKDYFTDVMAEHAQGFVKKSASNPFFIEVATFAPHQPAIPAPRDADLFPDLKAPRTPAYGARPGPDAPVWLKRIEPLTQHDEHQFSRLFRKRAQSVQSVDKMLADLRATIAQLGETDNTYIVFSSDNGLHLGEYSLRVGKMTPYEIDIHVPLIVVGPGIPKGVTINAMVENVDLCPTFTEIGGSQGPTVPDGKSLLSLLHGAPATDWRQVALIEHTRPFPDSNDPDATVQFSGDPSSYRALRTSTGLYVEYELDGFVEYHDLATDPDELKNTAASLPPAKKARLHEILHANATCKGAEACWAAQRMTPP